MQTPQAHLRDSSAKQLFKNQPLYLITDGGGLRATGKLYASIEAALRGGSNRIAAVQLREQSKSANPASDRELASLAKELLPLCNKHSAKLIINRNLEVALHVGADGIHVGFDELNEIPAIREKVKIVGYSSHSPDDATEAQQRGASYVSLSPIFDPISKASPLNPLGLSAIKTAKELCNIPIYALGGISPSNIKACRSAGADGVSMLSSILLSDDPKTQVEIALNAWD